MKKRTKAMKRTGKNKAERAPIYYSECKALADLEAAHRELAQAALCIESLIDERDALRKVAEAARPFKVICDLLIGRTEEAEARNEPVGYLLTATDKPDDGWVTNEEFIALRASFDALASLPKEPRNG